MRRRILLLVVGMTTLVVLAFAVPLGVLIHNNAYDNGVADLKREANDVALTLLRADGVTTAELDSYLRGVGGDYAASVQLPDGTVVGRQPPGGLGNAPAPSPYGNTPQDAGGGSGGLGDPDGEHHGGPPQVMVTAFQGGQLATLQAPAYRTGGLFTVRVFASDGDLRSGETAPFLLLLIAAAVLLGLAVVAGELLTRRIVRPLLDTAATAQRLSAGDTTARAPTSGPGEVAQVGVAMNRLADRIDQLIAEERETVAEMSHRLRTPMTALRLDAESLRDPAEAERIGVHVSALERMLTAVIRAARRPQREGRMPSCDATAVVGDRVGFWSALAEDQGRSVTTELPGGPLPVRAASEDLAAAVDALLENVIAHTPEGTAFAVRLTPTATGARLEVTDDGPGLPVEAPERGRSDRGSSGLGLDIARRCAEASGGSMTLGAAPSGGTAIVLELRAA